MASRLLATFQDSKGNIVRIYKNPDWDEFMCRLNKDSKSDYFTNDRQDALDTAKAMLRPFITPRVLQGV